MIFRGVTGDIKFTKSQYRNITILDANEITRSQRFKVRNYNHLLLISSLLLFIVLLSFCCSLVVLHLAQAIQISFVTFRKVSPLSALGPKIEKKNLYFSKAVGNLFSKYIIMYRLINVLSANNIF